MSHPAGWYADPNNAAQMQYWDGAAWTGQTSPVAAQSAPAPAAAAAPAYAGGAALAPSPYGAGAGYGAPAYGAPAYGAPAYGAPAYGAPAYAHGGPAMPPALTGVQLADYGARIGATVIDGLFVMFTLFIGLFVNVFLMGREGERNGQTLGKQVLNIRVVREDGQAVSVGFAALRELVVRWLLIGFAGGFFLFPPLLDVLWPLWDDRNQTLHDKMVSSYVVQA